MRLLKTSGGLIHGRGISDSTLSQFVHAMPHTIPICQYLEDITGCSSVKSEQHKDLRATNKKRDEEDLNKFIRWLEAHSPCDYDNIDGLVSLTTGEVGGSKINCDQAVIISTKAADAIDGHKFTEISLKSSDKVVTFSSLKNKITVRGQTVDINPTLLFHKITCILNSSAEMEIFLTYELAPYPPAIFKSGLMRKNTKSDMATIIKSGVIPMTYCPERGIYIIDGGYLLRKCVWKEDKTFSELCQLIIEFVLKHYGKNSTIVFDGYESQTSTKRAEQKRRAIKKSSPDLLFQPDGKPTTSQDKFLQNSNNKSRFINLVRHHCRQSDIKTLQADADADQLIVATALDTARMTADPVIVVGNDTDLTVMLLASPRENMNLFIMLETIPVNIYEVNQLEKNVECPQLLNVIHSMTGCDTTSAIFGHAKNSGMAAFKKMSEEEKRKLNTFLTASSNIIQKKEEITAAGEMFLLKLYGAKKNIKTLDRLRYIRYNQQLKSAKVNMNFKLETLPPTSAAARLHFYRVYHAVRQAMGNHLNPLDWGWMYEGADLVPIYTEQKPAPDRLLKMVSCGCKAGGCGGGRCSCVKLGIHCSVMCSNCNGESCKNSPQEPTESADTTE